MEGSVLRDGIRRDRTGRMLRQDLVGRVQRDRTRRGRIGTVRC